MDKKFDKYDDHPSIYYTGKIYRYFRNFKRVNRSEHGSVVNELNKNLEYQGESCYKPSENACLLKCIDFIFQKDFGIKYFEFIQSYKRRTNVTTGCRFPDFCERYKIDIGIYDFKSKRILSRSVKQRENCLHNHKNHYCVIWKKNRKDTLLNGVKQTDRNFKYV